MNLTLRNIEVGPVTQATRAAPTPDEPGRKARVTSRMYRLSFAADRPGIAASFTIDIGWDGRPGESNCPMDDLEELGRTFLKEFATDLARSA